LEQYAILLVRVSIGLFFAISGANKLFSAGGTKPVYDTLVQAKVPFPRQTAYFVAGVEFVCGSLVAVGFLSSPASVALGIDMIVAILTNTLAAVPKGLSRLNWLDDVLYLPEVLYVLFFIWLICSGPGRFSVDYWLAGKLLRWSMKQLVAMHELDGHYQNFSAAGLALSPKPVKWILLVSGYATYQASEFASVNTSAFYGIYLSSSCSGNIGVEKSLELHKRTQS
jgi:putative oxidoreductase